MSPAQLAALLRYRLTQAHETLGEAEILLEQEALRGTINRAYYAMFNAAHAALLRANAQLASSDIRRHGTLISAFGLYLVHPGLLPADLGRMLNKAESARILADYTGEEIAPERAAELVVQAERFVTAVDSWSKGRT